MEEDSIEIDKLINYWTNSSDDDYLTMLAMFESKRYNWSLFVGHLMIEKLLKACYVKVNQKYPPHTHNLVRLSELCHLKTSNEQILWLTSITAFNINARYDDYKMSFQILCNQAFATEWIAKLTELRTWINTHI